MYETERQREAKERLREKAKETKREEEGEREVLGFGFLVQNTKNLLI